VTQPLDTRTHVDAGSSTPPAETAIPARTRPLVEYHDGDARVRHGKSSVWVSRTNGKVILIVHERGRCWNGSARVRVNTVTSVALVDGAQAQVARAIESSVRLARSTEMVDGHPVWCNARDCRTAADGLHSLGTCELDLDREETANISLYRRKDGQHRVEVYVTTEYSGECSVKLTLDEATAVAQLLRFASR
jgi:hypothetical protein